MLIPREASLILAINSSLHVQHVEWIYFLYILHLMCFTTEKNGQGFSDEIIPQEQISEFRIHYDLRTVTE